MRGRALFLTQLLHADLTASTRPFVFTTLRGKPLRRSGLQRRPVGPGRQRQPPHFPALAPVAPGLTFHGLRHSHKTWLIEDGVPEVAQARRLGHAMQNKIDDVYSHVATSVEERLLRHLEARWQRAIEHHNREGDNPEPLRLTA
ncbi:tyrosine-type recombinase/integrase [Streptomyces sp. MNU89]|uniref:tyrosine-type recombinase/integrase n=1 Tax=Streptomyces sp. MNU89 TaxID=2560025 RepID=UPI001E2D058D|nr:tyrosine-type recombinase/integrase [Streptomyces sp. MNU89]MCC9738334.1 tyrosine-type recombinase/integrase [Streptomyces sp. MNU89]